MNKNIYLSWKEQQLFEIARKKDIISNEEIKNIFYDVSGLNKAIHGLLKKGYFLKLKKGLYLVCEERRKIIKNPFMIALALFKGYIGLSSALRFYDLLDYESFTVFVITTKIAREKKIADYLFKAVSFSKRATGYTFSNDIYVSTLAKTFFDCFYKPQYVGYSEITKALYQTKIDWKEFLSYFELTSASFKQRTGYVLWMMKNETGYNIPSFVLEYFKRSIKTKSRLLPSSKASGIYNKEWKVQDNLGKENILSWY